MKYIAAIVAVLAVASGIASAGTVLEPHEWRPLAAGINIAHPSTSNPPDSHYFVDVAGLEGYEFSYLLPDPQKNSSVQYGRIDFDVAAGETVVMLTTQRYGGGGSAASGNWYHEVSFYDDLVADGWIDLGSDQRWGYGNSFDNLTLVHSMDLWQRTFETDAHLELRTEKYQSPVLLRAVAVPEPAAFALALLSIGGLMIMIACVRTSAIHRRGGAKFGRSTNSVQLHH